MKVYDASGKILGRMATVLAKEAIKGETIHVVHAENAILTGNPEVVKKKYYQRIIRGDVHHGPYFPKTPDGIVKRSIRGMIDYKKLTGRNALKRVKVWIGIPEKFKNVKPAEIKVKDVNMLKTKHITIGDLSVALGAKKRW